MQVINKKIIIVIFICLSIFIFGLFKLFNKEKVVLDDVILDINNSKDSLAIYIEEYDEEGNASYVESKDNKFPIEDYVYNKNLSGCLDSNSNEVNDALNYNYINKELNLRVNKPVTCYVYYDYKGEGTETIPYKIRSVEDLLDLSQKVNSGTTYANTYFELTRDLDFQDINSYNDSERIDYGELNGITTDNNTLMNELTTGTGWVPIGKSNKESFQGIFDGNNKEIYNFYLNNNDSSVTDSGLFGRITKQAKIKNLTLDGEVTSNALYVGGIVANGWESAIDNCHNKSTVTGTRDSAGDVGGIIGVSGHLTIKNSSNEGTIVGNAQNLGGLIGRHNDVLTIENSYNEGTITNSLGQYVGGLLGRDDKATNTTTILNSYNKGEINTNIDASVSGVVSGGLIGITSGKTIMTNSYNEGNITGGNRVGGLIGQEYETNNIVIIDKCYNLGNLSPSKNNNWQGGVHVGGIISQVWNGAQLYIFNSYNAGNMEANLLSNGYAGFISIINGDTINSQKVNIVNSYNIGNIANSNFGIGFSRLSGGALKLNNVYSNIEFDNVTTKYGIGQFTTGQEYDIKKAYYKNADNITGSNITNNEIIGKDLSYMQSNDFVTELNKNIDSIKLTDYIDNSLLTEFKNKTGYELTLSKWTLKDNHPVLIYE